MNGKQLRNSILQWAISGRLVPQDPADEPASLLLKRINPKATPITEDVPFTIPDNWCWTTLGEIGKWQSGSTPSRTRSDYYGGNIPWLKTGDLNDGLIKTIPENITQKALEETSVKLNPAGSVLIAMYGATVGKIGILTFPATTNQACCACSQYKVEQMYLFYFLLANRTNFIAKGVGGAQPNISKEKIVATPFPLPPLAEQERIVGKVEELLPLVERYDKAQTELDRLNASLKGKLRASVLQEAIAGRLVPQDPNDEPASELLKRINPKAAPLNPDDAPFSLPDSWCWCKVGDISNSYIGLTYKPAEVSSNGVIVLRSSNIKDGRLSLNDIVRVTTNVPDKLFVENNDILICARNGSKRLVGKSALIIDIKEPMTFGAFMAICKTQLYKFVYIYLQSDCFFSQLRDVSGTTTINQLTQKNLNNFLIPLPPLAEQERIVGKVEELLAVLDALQ